MIHNQLQQMLQSLNPQQQEAVHTLNGPLLILAGAGSGKTKVLTCRIAHLISSGEASAPQILAVTFTNKAAREMGERVSHLLKAMNIPIYEPLWVSTFHSLCVRLLRNEIHLLNYQPFFSIYDSDEQLSLIKKIVYSLNLNDKMYAPKMFQAKISEAKRQGLGPSELKKRPRFFMDEKIISVFEKYEEAMKNANALDFDDLLLKVYQLFTKFPEVLKRYQDQFQYILVDEYQDTNHIQYLLVHLLAKEHGNLCVVGDEDQSIYSWRGADIGNILSFEKDFPNCKIIKLEQNYRSTQTIVNAASAVIKNNTQRKHKTLFTKNEEGVKIVVREEANEYEEARFVVSRIEKLMEGREFSLSDFAIFYRTNAQSRVFEDLLRGHTLRYRLVGGVGFYERMEIKNILAYFKVLANPEDEVACKRVINTPTRGIGKTTIETIEQYSTGNGLPFYTSILKVCDEKLVNSGVIKKLNLFTELIEDLKEKSKTISLGQLYLLVLDKTEYVSRLKQEATPEAESRIENLEELKNAISQFEQERGDEATLTTFLEEIALVSDLHSGEDSQPGVTLMTLHISKGLEFPVVFIVGCEEGLFPSSRAIADSDSFALEEERRIAYVGMTRARKLLHMTHARTRQIWGQEQSLAPSRFLNEIPEEYVDTSSKIKRPSFMSRHSQLSEKTFPRSHYPDKNPRKPFSPFQKQKASSLHFDTVPEYENFSDEISSSTFTQGMKVRHPTFGVGSIFQIEGEGDNQKISVVFSDHSFKKFVAKYARLERISK